MKRCAQCWREKPFEDFIGARGGEVQRCRSCRELYAKGAPNGRGSKARRGLPSDGPPAPRVIWTEESKNEKLGGIPSAIVSAETCPPSCGLYGRGCYAEFGFVGHHWRAVTERGISWDDFLERVVRLPRGQLWRYAVAGDLPGHGDELDTGALEQIVRANGASGYGRGFTFTHKPLHQLSEREAVRTANRNGFTVNLSADTLEHADARAELGIGPVVVTLPRPERVPLSYAHRLKHIQTPAGRRVTVCPAQIHNEMTCARCQLCSRPQRKAIVGFLAHGQMHATVSSIARGEKQVKLPIVG